MQSLNEYLATVGRKNSLWTGKALQPLADMGWGVSRKKERKGENSEITNKKQDKNVQKYRKDKSYDMQ